VVTLAAPAAAPARPWVAAPEMVLAVEAERPPPIARVDPACAEATLKARIEAVRRSFFIWKYPLEKLPR
jgi:hypothetical protein